MGGGGAWLVTSSLLLQTTQCNNTTQKQQQHTQNNETKSCVNRHTDPQDHLFQFFWEFCFFAISFPKLPQRRRICSVVHSRTGELGSVENIFWKMPTVSVVRDELFAKIGETYSKLKPLTIFRSVIKLSFSTFFIAFPSREGVWAEMLWPWNRAWWSRMPGKLY